MARVVVLGAGAMGLAAAHRALALGHDVTLLEAAPEPGGMAAHFDLGGLSIERFYHFVCKSDEPTFALMRELGIGDRMRWRPTSMGYFIGGALHPWGDPVSLLRFPHLGSVEKLRYGALMFLSTRRDSWEALEHTSARDWIERWCGKAVYDRLWRRLFDLKFYEYADNISAAWIWTRIQRVGRSRRSLLQEELGYIEGGSETLVHALVRAIEARGGAIRLGEPAAEIRTADGRVAGVETAGRRLPSGRRRDLDRADAASGAARPRPAGGGARGLRRIANIGVVCVVLKLRRSVTPHFWVNIVDPAMPVPGHHRVLQPARHRHGRDRRLRPLLHADDQPALGAAGRSLRRGEPRLHRPHQPGDRGGRPARLACRAPAARAAGLPAGLPGHDPARADLDRGPADRRHLLLLSGRSRHRGERAARGGDGGRRRRRDLREPAMSERARLLRFLLTGGASAAVAAVARWLLDLVLSYEAAVALSYLVGMTMAFVLARLFVFTPPEGARAAGWSEARGEYARFALVNAVAFAQVWIVSVGPRPAPLPGHRFPLARGHGRAPHRLGQPGLDELPRAQAFLVQGGAPAAPARENQAWRRPRAAPSAQRWSWRAPSAMRTRCSIGASSPIMPSPSEPSRREASNCQLLRIWTFCSWVRRGDDEPPHRGSRTGRPDHSEPARY